ncbi:hypothetical protein [Halocola ammonii]
MAQVSGEYIDVLKPNNKAYYHFNADQAFNPGTWNPPITWKGQIGGDEVQFVQIEPIGYHIDCFDWTDFPRELYHLRGIIVDAINEASRTMD